jgi:transketolase
MGDGELQEGQNWEAIMFAAGKKIDNLIATVDLNGKQIDGKTEDVMPMGNIAGKFKAFGWEVIDLKEGNDLKAIIETLQLAKTKTRKGKPVVIIMQTEMGNGVDYMMYTHAWHGKAPNEELLAKALDQNPETLGDY